jgi:Calcineurin-like phosphoesterase
VARTLVVSDLHLGTRAGADVLRRESVLDELLEGLAGIDRLILLGDAIEFRQSPVPVVLERAAPALRAIGERMAGRSVVLVPGNHDHVLISGWLAQNGARLGLEGRCTPQHASLLAERVAALLAPAAVEVAYPGLWLAGETYAMHGHYLDVHMTVPTLERLAIAGSARITLGGGRRWNDVRTPADYEALIAPLYAWIHAAAQTSRPSETVIGGRTVKAWTTLRSRGRGSPLRARTLATLFPLAVRGLNAAGIGPLRSELSMQELRRAGLRAFSEVVERLQIGARHVIFGHTHRAGPLEGDAAAEWLTPNGTRLHNTGSWVFSAAFTRDTAGPYWPGTGILVEDGEPPRLVRQLTGRDPAALAPPGPSGPGSLSEPGPV